VTVDADGSFLLSVFSAALMLIDSTVISAGSSFIEIIAADEVD
jgi:hypothetical protein